MSSHILSNSVFLKNLSPLLTTDIVREFLTPHIPDPNEILRIEFKMFAGTAQRYCQVDFRTSAGVTAATSQNGQSLLGVPLVITVIDPTLQASLRPPLLSWGYTGVTSSLTDSCTDHLLSHSIGYDYPPRETEEQQLARTVHVANVPQIWTLREVIDHLIAHVKQEHALTLVVVDSRLIDGAASDFGKRVALIELKTTEMADAVRNLPISSRTIDSHELIISRAKTTVTLREPDNVSFNLPPSVPVPVAYQQLNKLKLQEKISKAKALADRLASKSLNRERKQSENYSQDQTGLNSAQTVSNGGTQYISNSKGESSVDANASLGKCSFPDKSTHKRDVRYSCERKRSNSNKRRCSYPSEERHHDTVRRHRSTSVRRRRRDSVERHLDESNEDRRRDSIEGKRGDSLKRRCSDSIEKKKRRSLERRYARSSHRRRDSSTDRHGGHILERHAARSSEKHRRSKDRRRRYSMEKYRAYSPERRPSRSFEKRRGRSPERRPSRSFERRRGRSLERRPSRSLEKRRGRSLEKRRNRSLERRSCRSLERRPSRSFEKRRGRSLEKRSCRSPEKRSCRSPEKRSCRSPEKRSSRSPERRSSRSLERRPSRSLERRPSRSFERRRGRSLERRSSRSLEMRSSRSLERHSSPSPERRSSPSPERRQSRSLERRLSRSLERRSYRSPKRHSSRSLERRSSRSFEKRRGRSVEKRRDYSLERRRGHSHEKRRGHSLERRRGHSFERRPGYSPEKRRNYSRERRRSVSHERRRGHSPEKRRNYSHERRRGHSPEKWRESLLKKRRGYSPKRRRGYSLGRPCSHVLEARHRRSVEKYDNRSLEKRRRDLSIETDISSCDPFCKSTRSAYSDTSTQDEDVKSNNGKVLKIKESCTDKLSSSQGKRHGKMEASYRSTRGKRSKRENSSRSKEINFKSSRRSFSPVSYDKLTSKKSQNVATDHYSQSSNPVYEGGQSHLNNSNRKSFRHASCDKEKNAKVSQEDHLYNRHPNVMASDTHMEDVTKMDSYDSQFTSGNLSQHSNEEKKGETQVETTLNASNLSDVGEKNSKPNGDVSKSAKKTGFLSLLNQKVLDTSSRQAIAMAAPQTEAEGNPTHSTPHLTTTTYDEDIDERMKILKEELRKKFKKTNVKPNE